MNRKLIPHWAVVCLIAAAVILPAVICVMLGVAALLGKMGDAPAGSVLKYVAMAGGIVWVVDLIGLVLIQAINSLGDSSQYHSSQGGADELLRNREEI